MLERLSRTKRNLALGVLALAVLWFFWTVRSVLNPLILGYLLAFIVHPVVLKLEHRGWKRRKAVNLIYLGGGLSLSLMLFLIVAQGFSLGEKISQENKHLLDNAGDRIQSFLDDQTWLTSWLLDDEPVTDETDGEDPFKPVVEETRKQVESGEISPSEEESREVINSDNMQALTPLPEKAQEKELTPFGFIRALIDKIGVEQQSGNLALEGGRTALALAQSWFGSIMALVTLFVLTPIYAYFLLFELGHIHAFVRRYIPKRERKRMSNISRQIGEVLANFFRGRLTVCLIKGTILSLGLWIVGVDYALLLGMCSGFLALIPFAGPFMGFAFAFIVGLFDQDTGLMRALLSTGIVFAMAEVMEGYVLVPKILGDSLGLHPVVVFVTVFVGGASLGMFGFLLALPIMACIVILVRELVL
ncbi:MAG TPA: AI-2E family transporter, partial [Verrucomicrobia bacterium]|nr:AI-2E family transporter [Verrucomicrobiota bacterium]